MLACWINWWGQPKFISDIYENIYTKEDNEDLLVVSVLGP